MKNKITKRITVCAVAALTLLSTGCTVPQLAVRDSEVSENGAKGRLAGVYITKEPLQLTDIEWILEESLGKFMGGGTPGWEGDRVYATLAEYTFMEDGVPYTTQKYIFDDLEEEGMLLGAFQMERDGETYTFFDADEGLSDLHTALNHTDDGESTVQSAVIYQETGSIVWYFNPVYQTEDGSVYLMAGEGIHVAGGLGVSTTQTLKDSVTVTQNGLSETVSTEIVVSVKFAAVPDAVVILPMSGEHEILSRLEYTPDTLPDSILLDDTCAYVLVESHTDGVITRTLWQKGDDAPTVFRTLGNGICVKETVNFDDKES